MKSLLIVVAIFIFVPLIAGKHGYFDAQDLDLEEPFHKKDKEKRRRFLREQCNRFAGLSCNDALKVLDAKDNIQTKMEIALLLGQINKKKK